ncbi:MAG: hypothetical protein WD069_22095 [Planctomycetales bacterium]
MDRNSSFPQPGRNNSSGGSSKFWAGVGVGALIVLAIALKVATIGWRTYNRMDARRAERDRDAATREEQDRRLQKALAPPKLNEEALARIGRQIDENQSFVDDMERRFAELNERQRAIPAEAARDAAAILEQRNARDEAPPFQPEKIVAGERGTAAMLDLLGGTLTADENGQVTRIDLASAIVLDLNLRSLDAFTELRELDLAGTRITDKGIAHLSRVPRLEILDLSRTAATDGAIGPLSQIKSLRTLKIAGTKLTPEGVARLREALPDTMIEAE